MIGPVLNQEMLLAGRRQRTHFLRWLYLALICLSFLPLLGVSPEHWRTIVLGLNAVQFFETTLGHHYFLLVLSTPAFVAGAITEEKTRRTLDYLLTADLTASDIILGKLLARVAQLLVLSLIGMPLFSFFAGLTGDFSFSVAVVVTSVTLVFGLAALAMLVSVWSRSTRDALLCLYGVGLLVFLAWRLFAAAPWLTWLDAFRPFPVLAQADPDLRWSALGSFLLHWSAVAGAALFLACWRLRPAYRRQSVYVTRAWLRWLPGRSAGTKRRKVRGNPVLWRESVIEGIAPVASLRRWPRWVGLLFAWLVSGLTLVYLLIEAATGPVSGWTLLQLGEFDALERQLRDNASLVFYGHGLAFLAVLTLLGAIRASAGINGEKEKGTWSALAITPLTTEKIVQGKLWGIFWAAFPYTLAYAAAAVPLGFRLGGAAGVWAILWTLATLPALILGCAVGLWASARATTSWRSLLVTLGLFYAGWVFFLFPVSILLLVLKGLVELAVGLAGLFHDVRDLSSAVAEWNSWLWAGLSAVGLAYYCITERLLAAAVARVGRSDRSDDLDYFHLLRDYQRKLDERSWEAPKVIYWEEVEAEKAVR